MSAPNPQIYAFEYQFHLALAAELIANGINDPKKQQDSNQKVGDNIVKLKTPRVEIKYVAGGFSSEHYLVNQITRAKWPDLFTGSTLLKIVTNRTKTQAVDHAGLVGQCRYAMQNTVGISDRMQFHQVARLLENATSLSFSGDDLHDISVLAFDTWLLIRPAAFPQT